MEGVNVAKDHAYTSLNNHLGLNYLHDGNYWEVANLTGSNTTLTTQLGFNYFGGPDPHYSVDRMSTSVGEVIFSCETGVGRMILNEGENFKAITSSIILGALADGDGLSVKPYLISEIMNYFLGIGIDEYAVTLLANNEQGGEVSGAGNYLVGSYVELNAFPASGWAFANWTNTSGMIVSTEPFYTFSMPNHEVSLTANFEPITGITDQRDISLVSVKPNPVNDNAIIHSNIQAIGVSYFILDMSGKIVHSGIIQTQSAQLDLSHLNPGIYIFKLSDGTNPSLKIIKL